MRYRATSFGRDLAPWRATRDLAVQDAIEAREATRDQDGTIFSSPGLVIEEDDGAAPMTPEQERWAEALAVVRVHGAYAEQFVRSLIESLADHGEKDGVIRWRAIERRVSELREQAMRRQ